MSRKLHKFQTEAEYQAYSASTEYTTPCVAVVEENNVIYYDYGNNKPQVDMSSYKGEFQEISVGGNRYGRDAITKVHYIPSGITDLNYEFASNYSLEEVTCKIPDSVTSMNETFNYCFNLVTSIEIPSGVTSMRSTFFNCISIKEVTLLIRAPISYDSTFDSCQKLETIYVPDAALEDYKTATGWSQFASKFKPLSSKSSE